jgi:hypothetical protein
MQFNLMDGELRMELIIGSHATVGVHTGVSSVVTSGSLRNEFIIVGEHGFFRVVRGGRYQPGRGYWAVPNVPDF